MNRFSGVDLSQHFMPGHGGWRGKWMRWSSRVRIRIFRRYRNRSRAGAGALNTVCHRPRRKASGGGLPSWLKNRQAGAPAAISLTSCVRFRSLPTVSPKLEPILDRAVTSLKAALDGNLYSCCVYGSAVRGNAIEGVSDINLLIVLNESDGAAHQAITGVIEEFPQIDPFVLTKRGFERSARAFSNKFASIRRHYRVLSGADPLAEFKPDAQLERFLCEQSVRNLRLRLVYSFITRSRHKSYDRFVMRHVSAMFVQFSEALRLQGVSVPVEFEARIPVWEREFGIQGDVFRDLLALKRAPRRFTEAEAVQWHTRLFPLVDAVIRWIEDRWKG